MGFILLIDVVVDEGNKLLELVLDGAFYQGRWLRSPPTVIEFVMDLLLIQLSILSCYTACIASNNLWVIKWNVLDLYDVIRV